MTITDLGISAENHHHGDHHSVTAFGTKELKACAKCIESPKEGRFWTGDSPAYTKAKNHCKPSYPHDKPGLKACMVINLRAAMMTKQANHCGAKCDEKLLAKKNGWFNRNRGISEDTLTSIVRLRPQRMHRLIDFL